MQRSPTCGRCLENYEFEGFHPVGTHIPLILSCGHSFCEGCLFKLCIKKTEIDCPTCEAVTKLNAEGARGVKSLLPDIFLLGVLACNKRATLESGNDECINGPCWNFGNIHHLTEVKPRLAKKSNDDCEEKEEKEEKSLADMALCEGCSEEATCICKSCDDCLFCDSCFTTHHKVFKKLQKHKPVPLSFPRKSDIDCPEHSGRQLEFFDQDLDQPVCSLCLINEKCKNHAIVPIDQLDPEIQGRLTSSLTTANEVSSLLKISEKLIASAMPELTITANQILQDVKSFFNKMHASLQIREAAILSEASELFMRNFNLTSLVADCIQKQKSIEAILKEYSILSQQPNILRINIKKILAELEELKDMECFAKSIGEHEARLRFVAEEEKASWLKDLGNLEMGSCKMFEMLPLADISEDTRKLFSEKQPNEVATSIQRIDGTDLLSQDGINSGTMQQDRISAGFTNISSSFELVYVTYVKSPEQFYVQKCSDKDRLQNMMCNLNEYCKRSDRPEDLIFCPVKGDIVCAQFLADKNWYRARIVSAKSRQQPDVVPTLENGLPIEVYYLDYGNSESLPLARVRKMQPVFLQVPELAVPCSLVDIVPPDRKGSWHLKSVIAFSSLVSERPMQMNIRFRFNGRLYVDLKRSNELDEPTRDDDGPISLRDALVFLEVARFNSPESAPTAPAKPTRVYKEPISPKPDEQIDVVITHVVNPHEIYVQKFDSPINEIQEEMGKIYTERKNGEGTNITFPYRNLVCAARFSEDKMWYRGLVTNVCDDFKVEVNFVDYGNSEKTSLSQLRRLPDAYLNLRKQAMPVKLKDVAFLKGKDEWSPEAINFLKKTLVNKPMILISKVVENGQLSVELCDTSTDEDIYMNYLLVENCFASGTGQSATKNPYEIPPAPVNSGSTIGDSDSTSGNFGDETSETDYSARSDSSSMPLPAYCSQEIPPNLVFGVVGTFIDDGGNIFGHMIDGGAQNLNEVSQALNNGEVAKMPGLQSTSRLFENQACIAQFSVDQLWYRASVVQIIDKERVEVEFVDFGNREVVQAGDVRLSAAFLDIPKQAVKLHLHGIEAVHVNRKFPHAVIEALNSKLVNTTFNVRLEGVQRNPDALNVSIELGNNENLADSLLLEFHEELPHMRDLSLKDGYVDPTLPEVGVHFDVHVTQVDKPNRVYIQRILFSGDDDDDGPYSHDDDETEETAREEFDQFERITMLMNTEGFFDDDCRLEEVELGMLCCARYTKDDEWYRGKVRSVNAADDGASNQVVSAGVFFVDYGTTETLPIDRLRKIPENFADLPVQSIHCELAGFFPPESPIGEMYRDTKWPIKTMLTLFQIVNSKRLIACILHYGPPVKVILFDRIEAKDSETGEKVDTAVAQLLADEQLGIFDLSKEELTHSGADA